MIISSFIPNISIKYPEPAFFIHTLPEQESDLQILVDLQTINSPPGYPEPIIKDDIKIKAEPHVQSEPVVIKSDIESKPRSKPQPTINCSHYETIPASFKHKVTALTSFMGSGNTWTRHLIHRASGYWTGSIYSDTALHINGMIPEFIKPLDCEDAQDNSPYSAFENEASMSEFGIFLEMFRIIFCKKTRNSLFLNTL